MVRSLIFVFFCSLIFNSVQSQNANEEFGKNKIQYNDDQQEWWIYETTNIIYYWYGKSRKVAEFYITIAENENKKIREIFEFHLKDKIELVIYTDRSDLHQTNLDLDQYLTPINWNEEPKISEQKILLYFDGNHQNALRLLRKGLVRMYFNSIFSGSQLEEVVQKVISYKLPAWFESGLIDYLSDSWGDNDMFQMKGKWKSSGKNKFNRFYQKNNNLAGKSMWNYIVQQYGQQAISNWLYMIRIQKDLNSAARLVFQRNLKDLYDEWLAYYNRELAQINIPEQKFNRLKLRSEENVVDFQSYHKNKYLLSTNQNGKKRVRILDIDQNKLKTIYTSGHRNKITTSENQYPICFQIIAKNQLYIIDISKNRNKITILDSNCKLISKNILPEDILEIYDAEALNDKNIFFTGNNNGFSDVFQYNIKSRSYTKLTDDIFDELKINLNVVDSSIILNSARGEMLNPVKSIDSIIPILPFEIYNLKNRSISKSIPILGNGSKEDFQINKHYSLIKTKQYSNLSHYYKFKDELYYINEPFLTTIAINHQNELIKIYKKYNNKYYYSTTSDLQEYSKILTQFTNSNESSNKADSSIQDKKLISLFFDSEFEDPENADNILQDFQKKASSFQLSDLKNSEQSYQTSGPILKFNPNQSIAYQNRFSMDEWSTTLSNELLFGGLNTFTGNNPVYDVPASGILFKTKVKENFNHYFFDFGLRVPTNFKGSEAFVVFHNLKYRWDHSYAIYRKSIKNAIYPRPNLELQEVNKTFLLNHVTKYALDHYRSFRMNSTIRNDQYFFKATDKITLDTSANHIQSIGSRLEFVYDDALNLSLNIKEGTQCKVFFETNKRFNTNFRNGIYLKPLDGFLFIVGLDLRHHIPILKFSSFSNRFYINSSFGTQRLLNHLGGTENWLLFRKYNYEQPPDLANNYSFSQLVTEVRGHPISSRKGSSAMVYTSELRIPFFHYILHQNWKNSFLRNMQFIPFFDLGLSWQGAIPDFKQIEKFSYSAENPAVKINIVYNRNPFIAGAGLGLRTSIFGYFIRFDYAWPIQELKFRDPISHISLGFDF